MSRRSWLSGFSAFVVLLASLVGVQLRPAIALPGQWPTAEQVAIPAASSSWFTRGLSNDTRHPVRLPPLEGVGAVGALLALAALVPPLASGPLPATGSSFPVGRLLPGGSSARGPPRRA